MMQITFRMVNIPIPDDPERRRIIFGGGVNIPENETRFPRTVIVYANTDMSSRHAWMSTPQEIEVVIDYETMMPPTRGMDQFTDGASFWYSEPHPVVRAEYRDFTTVQTWFETGPTNRG